MDNWSASASSSSAKLRRLLGAAATGLLGLVAEEMDLNCGFDCVVVVMEPLVVGVLVFLSLSSSSSASSPPRRRKLRALLLIIRCRSGGDFLPFLSEFLRRKQSGAKLC